MRLEPAPARAAGELPAAFEFAVEWPAAGAWVVAVAGAIDGVGLGSSGRQGRPLVEAEAALLPVEGAAVRCDIRSAGVGASDRGEAEVAAGTVARVCIRVA